MEQASQRRQPLAISVALGLITAVVAWFLVSASSRADDVDLTTADLVPGDAAVYVGLNTDLDSSEWVAAFSLVEKLGREDPQGDLRRAIEDEGELDWDETVVPFLGGNAAFYMRSYDWSGDTPDEFGLIVRAKDPWHAMAVLLDELDAVVGQQPLDYEGQGYSHFQPHDEEPGYIATIGQHLVITTTEDEMHRVIDVANGKAPSLSENKDFKKLRDELSGHFLAFVYVDVQRVMEGFAPGLMATGFNDPSWPSDTGSAAFVVGAKESGFVFQSASSTIPEAYAAMLEPQESRFLSTAPIDTAVFISAHDVGEVVATGLEQMQQQFGGIDPSLWSDPNMTEEERQAMEEAFGQGDPFGDMSDYFGQAAEVARLLTGEVAMAVWLPDGEPTGVVMAEIDDETAVRDALERFLDADSYMSVSTEDYKGVDLTIVRDAYEEPAAFGIRDGVLYAGTLDGVKTVLDGVDSSLADSPRFARSRDELGVSLASFGYVDLHALFASGEMDQIPGLSRATETLQAVLITYVQERGVARLAGIVTIED